MHGLWSSYARFHGTLVVGTKGGSGRIGFDTIVQPSSFRRPLHPSRGKALR